MRYHTQQCHSMFDNLHNSINEGQKWRKNTLEKPQLLYFLFFLDAQSIQINEPRRGALITSH